MSDPHEQKRVTRDHYYQKTELTGRLFAILDWQVTDRDLTLIPHLSRSVRRGEVLDNQAGRDRIDLLQMPCNHRIDLFPIGPVGGEVIDQTDIFHLGAGLFEQDLHVAHRLLCLGRGVALADKALAVERQAGAAHQKDLVPGDHRLTGLKVQVRGEETVPGISCPNSLVRHQKL